MTEFARKQRERIISARKLKEAALAEETRKKKEAALIEEGRKKELGKKGLNVSNADDVTSARPSTAATTNAGSAQDQAPNLKGIEPAQQKKIINSEFMDYFGTFVTKGNVKTLPGTVNHIKAEAKRRALLN